MTKPQQPQRITRFICSNCGVKFESLQPRGVAMQHARRQGWRIGLNDASCPECLAKGVEMNETLQERVAQIIYNTTHPNESLADADDVSRQEWMEVAQAILTLVETELEGSLLTKEEESVVCDGCEQFDYCRSIGSVYCVKH